VNKQKVNWVNYGSGSPYGLALGSKVQKNTALTVVSGKNRKRGNSPCDSMAVYGKCEAVFLGK
jgi:hypothetical protein